MTCILAIPSSAWEETVDRRFCDALTEIGVISVSASQSMAEGIFADATEIPTQRNE